MADKRVFSGNLKKCPGFCSWHIVNEIPALYSNTDQGYHISGNWNYQNYQYKFFDKNDSTSNYQWLNTIGYKDNSSAPKVTIQLPEAKIFNNIRSVWSNVTPRMITIRASNDGSTWTVLSQDLVITSNTFDITFVNSSKYLYYQMLVNRWSSEGSDKQTRGHTLDWIGWGY